MFSVGINVYMFHLTQTPMIECKGNEVREEGFWPIPLYSIQQWKKRCLLRLAGILCFELHRNDDEMFWIELMRWFR